MFGILVEYRSFEQNIADNWEDGEGMIEGPGWFYTRPEIGSPTGYSAPYGPFESETEAIADSRQ